MSKSSGRNNRVSNSVIMAEYNHYGKAWCEYCGKQVFHDVPITAHNRVIGDHRIPMSRGGPNTKDNIAIACKECDFLKGPLTKEEFLRVRTNNRERKRLINKVLYDMGKVPRLIENDGVKSAYSQQRNLMRKQSLSDRLQDPDPDCIFCQGFGVLKKPGRLAHYCRCSVRPKKEDNETS